MKIISSKTHGILDYVVGVLLIAAPFVFGFATGGPAQWVPIILGLGTIAYSLLTRYELGAIRVLPFGTHLLIDAASGVFLLASPWLFGFADQVRAPHVIVGLLELAVVAMSQTQPGAVSTTPRAAVR
ncbi:MAG TPA: SPW repeat protein [Candidatus Synoicihabitans sp.]|nr:SPW repeat protein [Candidatus Synoicihabitans sp.]